MPSIKLNLTDVNQMCSTSLWHFMQQPPCTVGALESTQILDIMKGLLSGLHHIHSTLLVAHGDLSGSNVLMTADRTIKICDLGCVCHAECIRICAFTHTSMTLTTMVAGIRLVGTTG